MAIFGIPQERKSSLFRSVGKTELPNNPKPSKSFGALRLLLHSEFRELKSHLQPKTSLKA